MNNAQLRAWANGIPSPTHAELARAGNSFGLTTAGLNTAQLLGAINTFLLDPANAAVTYTPPVAITTAGAPGSIGMGEKLLTIVLGIELIAALAWIVLPWPFWNFPGRQVIILVASVLIVAASVGLIIYACTRQPDIRHNRPQILGMILAGVLGAVLESLVAFVVMFGLLRGWSMAALVVSFGLVTLSATWWATHKHIFR